MKKQPEVTDQTRQRFMDVFCGLYARMPFEQVTVKQIVALAGCNRSTFYQYFHDTRDVRAAVEDEVIDAIRDNLSAFHSDGAHVRAILGLFTAKQPCLDALLGDFGTVGFVERLKQELPAQAQFTGPFTPYLAEFNAATTVALFHLWRHRGKDLPLETILGLIETLHASGLSTLAKSSGTSEA